MALSILDGTQTATTLSTILSSGQHITAHTVVSLGTQAVTDMRSAVSGSVVSISNFPATQPVSIASVTIGSLPLIAGTVTANVFGLDANSPGFFAQIPVIAYDEAINDGGVGYVVPVQITNRDGVIDGNNFLPISGTVTVGNSVTIAGTVTANPTGTQTIVGTVTAGGLWFDGSSYVPTPLMVGEEGELFVFSYLQNAIPAGTNRIGVVTIGAGTVTIGAGTAQIGSVTASISNFPATQAISIASVTIGNSVTIGSLPAISGTVTANTFAVQGTAVTTSNFTSTTASTLLAGLNATRQVLTIFSEGPGTLFVSAGATCTTIQYQVRLSSGDYYEVPNHQTTITHSAVFATGGGTARVTEVS